MNELVHPISTKAYRERPEINHSLLKFIDQSPAHLQYARANPMKPTPAMKLGTVEDHLLFGTECRYEVSPFKDFRKQEAQTWRDEREAAGVVVLTQDQNAKTQLMIQRIREHPDICKYFENGLAQVAGFASLSVGNDTTVDCKCLIDWMCDSDALLLDLKTTDDASPDAFQRKLLNMGYDVQAAFYTRIAEYCTEETFRFGWVVVESEPPHHAALYIAEQEVLERGYEIMNRRLRLYAQCIASGQWPAYPGVRSIGLPRWAMPKGEPELL